MPKIKGQSNTRFTSKFGLGSPSDRNFMIPGMMLDTDSEADASKFAIREKLLNVSTTRNIRNKTIDVPSLDLRTTAKKAKINARSNLGQV